MILIVTGTMLPPQGIHATVLMDEEERIRQYKEALLWFINNSNFTKIVFGENSNTKTPMDDIRHAAEKQGKKFEFLTFQGNEERVRYCGKGYGEGEILQHVIKYSILLEGEIFFYKITGRLIIKNINVILEKMYNKRSAYILCKYGWMYTWFYGMPIKVYQKYFKDIYMRTDDRHDKVLESMWFFEGVNRHLFYWSNRGILPEIIGQSGSSGKRYEDLWKNAKKDVIDHKGKCVFLRICKSIEKHLKG